MDTLKTQLLIIRICSHSNVNTVIDRRAYFIGAYIVIGTTMN